MIKVIEFADDVKYIVDKYEYENYNIAKNMAFMLDKNLDNPEFLKSDLYKKLEDKYIDSLVNAWLVTLGILDKYNLSVYTKFKISRDHTKLVFIERENS